MEEISKVGIDLLFCLIVGFIIVQASNSANQNESLINSLTSESTRISFENLK